MERDDDFPQDEARRWVLAKIVQLGVSCSLSSLNINIALPEVQHKETKPLLPLKAMHIFCRGERDAASRRPYEVGGR